MYPCVTSPAYSQILHRLPANTTPVSLSMILRFRRKQPFRIAFQESKSTMLDLVDAGERHENTRYKT